MSDTEHRSFKVLNSNFSFNETEFKIKLKTAQLIYIFDETKKAHSLNNYPEHEAKLVSITSKMRALYYLRCRVGQLKVLIGSSLSLIIK